MQGGGRRFDPDWLHMSYLSCPYCGNNNFIGQYFAEITQEVQLNKRGEHTLWEWGDEEHREAQEDDAIRTVYCRPCDKDLLISVLVETS